MRILLLVCFVFWGNLLFAQSSLRTLERAEDQAKRFAYAASIETYEGLLKRAKDLTVEDLLRARLGLAEAYFLTKDNINAERVYAEALQSMPVLKGDNINAYKRYAQVLSGLGKYSDSKFFWEKYTEFNENDKKGVQFAKLYSGLTPLLRNQASYKVEYVGINSGFPDFSPAYYKNGLVFVSGRKQSNIIKRVFSWDNSNFLDLFYLENVEALKSDENTSAVLGIGGNNVGVLNSTGKETLGKDYYTAPTPNDAPLVGTTGSIRITGTMDYKENPTVPSVGFSKKINSKYHEGPSVFYEKGSKIIFTRGAIPAGTTLWSKLKGDGVARLKLYSAEKKGNDWGEVSELPFNSNDFSCGHPAITEDGRLLFFVSDMPGGFGGTDLYYSEFKNGRWEKPKNAGPRINTSGDELFPFLGPGGDLYFATDGLPGLGSLDIFVVKINLDTKEAISAVRNIGAPINSQYDDFGIITDADRSSGYFSSNRKRGGSDDDIYKFTRTGPLYGCRDLLITVRDGFDNKPIENFKFTYAVDSRRSSPEIVTTNNQGAVSICLEADQRFSFQLERAGYKNQNVDFSNFDASDFETETLTILMERELPVPAPVAPSERKEGRIVQKWTSADHNSSFRAVITDGFGVPIAGTRVRFISKCNGEIQEMISRKDGTVEFKRNLECDYELVSSKEGYGISRDVIDKAVRKNFFGRSVEKPVSVNLFNSKLYKVGDVIRLENIYYTSDGFKLNSAAKKELSRLADVLQKHPDMAIEVISHTDTRGSAVANKTLSDLRAKEVYEFLIRSIDKSRVRAIGKGESEPVNNCGDGVQCTESEHARNRRTEFKVLRMEKI